MPPITRLTFADTGQLGSALSGATAVGLDTEFMREDTFFAQLCLVQIATESQILLLDPLAEDHNEAMWDDLLDRDWTLHSGRQDIEVIQQTTGKLPRSLFDTQIAAGLLGYPPQLGYANLVRELFGVELKKTQTRADWSRRPLSKAMEAYAAEDVEYLIEARERLVEKLTAEGRAGWAEEDSAALLDVRLYEADPEAAIDRLKAARNLKGAARSAARALASWREARAISRNRPRQWIMRDAVLVEIARRRPGNLDELAEIDGLAQGTLRRAGGELISLARAASASPERYEPPSPPSESDKALLKTLQKQVAHRAEELNLAAEILAPRRELAAAVRGETTGRVFVGWRQQVIGTELLEMLG
ncbi:MAG: ribonuclease D [Pseudomonadota bacterium]